jgi:large subunit ribosomal protein L37Ae
MGVRTAKYTCTFCGKNTTKRKAVGIWHCKACNRTTAGGRFSRFEYCSGMR